MVGSALLQSLADAGSGFTSLRLHQASRDCRGASLVGYPPPLELVPRIPNDTSVINRC
jgi:hypothetical protein